MKTESSSGHSETLLLALILLRVGVILVVWLGLFLAMFLGYFTVPILLVGGLALVYSIVDIGMVVALRRENQVHELRKAFLSSQSRHDEPEGKA